MTILGEEDTSALAGFHTGPLFRSSSQVKSEFGNVGSFGGNKTEVPGEKPLEQGQDKNQKQTQPVYVTRLELHLGYIGGR